MCELIWSVEKICIGHSNFSVLSIWNVFEIFVLVFVFCNNNGSNNLKISFSRFFFFHILNHRPPLKVIRSRFNCCGNIDTRFSMCFMLSMNLSVNWYRRIKLTVSGSILKRFENFKNYHLFFSFFFWLIISLQTCII